MAIVQRRPVGEAGDTVDPRRESPIQVIPRDNNGSTDPAADQTNPWYDRPKVADPSSRAPERDPAQVTGVPFEGEKMPKNPEPKPSGEPSLLNWVPGQKGPLN
jgi:hypothetical protein